MALQSESLTGIILAGGQSSRMKRDKGLVPLLGKPLIEYVAGHLEQLCHKILISSNSQVYDYLGYTVVPDEFPGFGPAAGIYSCLKRSADDYNLVVSCDTPFFDLPAMHCLLERRMEAMVVVPWYGGEKYEPLCAVYNRKMSQVIKDFMDLHIFKLPVIFRDIPMVKLSVMDNPGCFQEHAFVNINTIDEVKDLEKRIKEGLIHFTP
ncbi:MAG: molybdenum cofactor guanylyltransferase [Bacteroidetes bacterium]|nr:molybdenum cofactor guanylyltransferase [Bacteroidota bacterium]